jgi:hypothetical protein
MGLVLLVALTSCGTSARAPSHPSATDSSREQCNECRPIEVGAHAAFVVGKLELQGSNGGTGPSPVVVIFRKFRVGQRGDILVSGVLTASNQARSSSSVVLISTVDHGGQASAHEFPQEVDTDVPAGRSVTIPYHFVYPGVQAGRERFTVQAAVSGAGLTLGAISLVLQPLH